jgi:hypothetical protein
LDSRDVTTGGDEASSMTKKLTLAAAEALRALRIECLVPNAPLRSRPVIVLAEDEVTYRVTTLGVAVQHGLTIAG